MIKIKTGHIAAGLLICIGAILLVWAGREAAAGAASAVSMCLTVIIPSLFAFTVISKLLISSGVYTFLGRPFRFVSRYIFRVPEDFMPVFIISQVAGYPIGAALISEMHRCGRISKSDAEKLLCFCIAPGPAYIMAVSQAVSPQSYDLWAAVFAAVCGGNLLMLLVSAPFRSVPGKTDSEPKLSLTAQSFTDAVKSGCESMLMICGMIIFMSSLLGIAGKAGILADASKLLSAHTGHAPAEIYPFVRSFFEISNLTGVSGDGTEIIPAAAAMLSFGGVCVCMQIWSVCGGFSPLRAVFMRIPCSVCAYFICRGLIPKFYTVSVIAVNAPVTNAESGHNSPFLSIILLIMTILIISQKSIVKNKKI